MLSKATNRVGVVWATSSPSMAVMAAEELLSVFPNKNEFERLNCQAIHQLSVTQPARLLAPERSLAAHPLDPSINSLGNYVMRFKLLKK